MAHHHFLALGLKIDTSERFTDVVFLDNYFDIPVQERLFHNNHRGVFVADAHLLWIWQPALLFPELPKLAGWHPE